MSGSSRHALAIFIVPVAVPPPSAAGSVAVMVMASPSASPAMMLSAPVFSSTWPGGVLLQVTP